MTLSELNIKLPFIKMNKFVPSEEITEMQKKIGNLPESGVEHQFDLLKQEL